MNPKDLSKEGHLKPIPPRFNRGSYLQPILNVSSSELQTFSICPTRYQLRKLHKYNGEESSCLTREIGRTVHALFPLSAKEREERLAQLHHSINPAVLRETEDVAEESRILLANADSVYENIARGDHYTWEKNFNFLDPVTRFRLYAQPEKVLRPSLNEIVIFELKTSPQREHLPKTTLFQMKFTGWVILQELKAQRDINYNITLRVFYARTKETVDVKVTESVLEGFMNREVRPKLRRLRKSVEKDLFKPGSIKHCKDCHFRHLCPIVSGAS